MKYKIYTDGACLVIPVLDLGHNLANDQVEDMISNEKYYNNKMELLVN